MFILQLLFVAAAVHAAAHDRNIDAYQQPLNDLQTPGPTTLLNNLDKKTGPREEALRITKQHSKRKSESLIEQTDAAPFAFDAAAMNRLQGIEMKKVQVNNNRNQRVQRHIPVALGKESSMQKHQQAHAQKPYRSIDRTHTISKDEPAPPANIRLPRLVPRTLEDDHQPEPHDHQNPQDRYDHQEHRHPEPHVQWFQHDDRFDHHEILSEYDDQSDNQSEYQDHRDQHNLPKPFTIYIPADPAQQQYPVRRPPVEDQTDTLARNRFLTRLVAAGAVLAAGAGMAAFIKSAWERKRKRRWRTSGWFSKPKNISAGSSVDDQNQNHK